MVRVRVDLSRDPRFDSQYSLSPSCTQRKVGQLKKVGKDIVLEPTFLVVKIVVFGLCFLVSMHFTWEPDVTEVY